MANYLGVLVAFDENIKTSAPVQAPIQMLRILHSPDPLCRLPIMGGQLSNQMLRLASAMLDDPAVPRYGLELSKSAGLKTGTIYPALARMERSGWVESHWEAERAKDLGRPRRRLYQLTGAGEVALRQAIEDQLRAIQRPATRTRRPSPKTSTA